MDDKGRNEMIFATNLLAVIDALILEISNSTGYPTDMLSKDSSIVEDLGIDETKFESILNNIYLKFPYFIKLNPKIVGNKTIREISNLLLGIEADFYI